MTFKPTDEEQRLFDTRPPMPTDRPATRAEVWAYAHHFYAALKTEDDLRAWSKKMFVDNYIQAVNFNGWLNPPDWKEGEPVVPAACPTKPFLAGAKRRNTDEVYRLLELQKGGST